MIKFDILRLEECYHNNDLRFIGSLVDKKVAASPTDFAVDLGAAIIVTDGKFWVNDNIYGVGKTGKYTYICNDGIGLAESGNRQLGIGFRPIIRFSNMQELEEYGLTKSMYDKDIYYLGKYPMTREYTKSRKRLNSRKLDDYIVETGKTYTIIKNKELKVYNEIEFEGQKYIRIKPQYHGRPIIDDELDWIRIQDVPWYLTSIKDEYILISEYILAAGIDFSDKKRDKNWDWNESDLKKFLDIFAADLLGDKKILLESQKEENHLEISKLSEDKSANINKINQEKLLELLLKSNVPILLEGKEVDGKSKIIKEYDPDCEIICLNNIDKESLIGKNIYNPRIEKMVKIKPEWLDSIERKCENNPNKIHILLFEEIEKVSDEIQEDIKNIINQRKINGKWDLPQNVRIILSGENLKDKSIAKNFRDNTIKIEIKPDAKNWLMKAKKEPLKNVRIPEEQIHPLIYKFIEYKDQEGEDLISSSSERMPELNPRKWEFASRLMYVSNNPELLEPILGSDVTRDFEDFCKEHNSEKTEDATKISNNQDR